MTGQPAVEQTRMPAPCVFPVRPTVPVLPLKAASVSGPGGFGRVHEEGPSALASRA
jgi:hypothetical protein